MPINALKFHGQYLPYFPNVFGWAVLQTGEVLKDLWADEPCSMGGQQGTAQGQAADWLGTEGKPVIGAKFTKWKQERRKSLVPAVEVDAPGCSYNPDEEQRKVQGALSQSLKVPLSVFHSSRERSLQLLCGRLHKFVCSAAVWMSREQLHPAGSLVWQEESFAVPLSFNDLLRRCYGLF